MKKQKIVIFGYDFLHKKTQDFILKLFFEKYDISAVISAPWEPLNIPPSILKIHPQYYSLTHPQKICKSLNIEYHVMPHNAQKCISYLSKKKYDLGIIAGARILKKEIIESFSQGIINIHPGLLPEMRGLDTIQWSIYKNIPLGLTSHFISPKIDQGRMINKETLPIYEKDSLMDISRRLLEMQPDFLIESLKNLENHKLKNLDSFVSDYHSKMPENQEKEVLNLFQAWKKNNSLSF